MKTIVEQVKQLAKDSPGKYTRKQAADLLGAKYKTVRGVILDYNLGDAFLDAVTQKTETEGEAEAELNIRALEDECTENGIDISDVQYFWHKSDRISMMVVAQNKPSYESIRAEQIKAMQAHAPKYPTVKRSKMKDGHLLVIDPADVHVGKLSVKSETGYEYNMEIAVDMATRGVDGILEKASGFPVEKIMLVIGNDIMHIDTPGRTTTSGTRQDTDGMWHQNYIAARKLYVMLIERLIQFADVDVVFNPSNHDYISGFMLADSIASWFHNCKQVTFDCDIIHRKYYQYGQNLIVTTHGDGAKFSDMPLLMASEQPQMWASTRHRYAYVHHLHHRQKHQFMAAKDFPGITLEVMRSPSAGDGWHQRQGFTGAPQAIEGAVHHPIHGKVAHLSHIF